MDRPMDRRLFLRALGVADGAALRVVVAATASLWPVTPVSTTSSRSFAGGSVIMTTHDLGDVEIAPHAFFMAMGATSIEQYSVSTLDGAARQTTLRGGLTCHTEVGEAETVVGDRHAAEHATYRVEAIDSDGDDDDLRFTVSFDPDEAPVNHGSFGPSPPSPENSSPATSRSRIQPHCSSSFGGGKDPSANLGHVPVAGFPVKPQPSTPC